MPVFEGSLRSISAWAQLTLRPFDATAANLVFGLSDPKDVPVMDGFEFVMEMRKRDDLRSIPIVVVTAKNLTEDDPARLNGDVAYRLSKRDLGQEELLSHLREFVSSTGRG